MMSYVNDSLVRFFKFYFERVLIWHGFSEPKIEVLTAFSIYTNTKKLLHASKGTREQIQIFHGLKFISMMWIIAGHGMVGVLSTPLINLFTAGKVNMF